MYETMIVYVARRTERASQGILYTWQSDRVAARRTAIRTRSWTHRAAESHVSFDCLARVMRLDSAPPGVWPDVLAEWDSLAYLHVFLDDSEQPDMLRTALPDLQWVQVGGVWGMAIDDALALWGPCMTVPRPGERDSAWPAEGFSWCQWEVCPAAAFTRI